MHSVAIATILAGAATLSSAAPSVHRRGAYYVCYNNGFRGECSVDPCAIPWCPDYIPYTYNAVAVTNPPPVKAPAPTTSAYYVCASNGFRGDCSVDPCALAWCPDYTPYTYTSVKTTSKREPAPQGSDPTVCAPGTGYFQSCSNGFRGCCRGDACGSTWCPDSEHASASAAAARRAPEPVAEPAAASDPTVCAPGTGFFQSCAKNGFRGCCKSDACGSTWCADYKPFTYERVAAAPVPTKPETPAHVPAGGDPTVCAAGTGFYQVCANGFKGCCKKDACSLGYCPL